MKVPLSERSDESLSKRLDDLRRKGIISSRKKKKYTFKPRSSPGEARCGAFSNHTVRAPEE